MTGVLLTAKNRGVLCRNYFMARKRQEQYAIVNFELNIKPDRSSRPVRFFAYIELTLNKYRFLLVY